MPQPFCCCNPLVADDFGGMAVNTGIWTVSAGSFTVGTDGLGNQWLETSSANALIVPNVMPAAMPYSVLVSLNVYNGCDYKIYFGTSSNFCEIVNNGTQTTYTFTIGGTTYDPFDGPSGTFVDVMITVTSSRVTLCAQGNPSVPFYIDPFNWHGSMVVNVSGGGDYFALGTGAGIGGAGSEFGHVRLYPNINPCFSCGGCAICPGTTPRRYQLVINSYVPFGCMTDLAGTYILELDDIPGGWVAAGADCSWSYIFPGGSPCGAGTLTLNFTACTTPMACGNTGSGHLYATLTLPTTSDFLEVSTNTVSSPTFTACDATTAITAALNAAYGSSNFTLTVID
jgi:hypothetical protein